MYVVLTALGIIAGVLLFFTTTESAYKDYNCRDRTVYKCKRCKKRCLWKFYVRKYEELTRRGFK